MNCQTCGAALGRGTAAHHLTCRYCGAVHSTPTDADQRPYDDALNSVLDETGMQGGSGSESINAFELNAECYSSTAEVPPDVRAALNDASRALDDIFGGPPMRTQVVGAGEAKSAIASAAATVAPAGVAAFPEIAPAHSQASASSMDETAPMPPMTATELLAAAQVHSHSQVQAREEIEAAAAAPSAARESAAASPAAPESATRPTPARVVIASDPVAAQQPEWMKHAVVMTAIAVIAVFTLAGIAIVLY
jgi:hypothetical protein